MIKFFLKRWKHNERNLLLREAKYSWISREREKRRKNSAKKLRKLYRRGPCHLPHPLFSPLDGEYFTRRSRTVVHHSCLNRGSIYERYHLFSRPMKFTASIFRHRTRPINILPPSIDRSIDFYAPGKRYQLTLSLHVCIRSYMNFVVMIHFPIFFFFLETWIPFRDLEIIKHLIVFDSQTDPLNGEFSITSIEFLTIFERIYAKSWTESNSILPFLNALVLEITRYFVLLDKKFQFIFEVNFIVKNNALDLR